MTYSIQWLDLGTIVTFRGAITVEMLNEAHKTLESDGRFYDDHKYSIWDFTLATLYGISENDMRRIIAGDIGVGTTKATFKVAVISSDIEAKVLLDHYRKTISNFNPGWEARMYPDFESAQTWVNGKP